MGQLPRSLVALLTASLLFGLAASRVVDAGPQQRPDREDYSSGRHLYRVYCAPCHGDTGKGDGPVANAQRLRPGDLGSIARRNGGVFPTEDVTRMIDGRQPSAGHARGEMPVWGRVLPEATDAERQKQIAALVAHVARLQIEK
jgi:mono/diheme cytochrome c family protein